MRLAPTDFQQAETLVAWMRDLGADSVAVFHDDRVFGREVASQIAAAATGAGLDLTRVDALRLERDGYDELALELAEEGAPDAVLYTGITPEVAGPFYDAVERRLPDTLLFGSSGVASATFESGARVRVVKAARPLGSYPAAARRVIERLDRVSGARAPVEAVYGYEAMRIVVDAIERAGADAGDRAAVTAAALEPRLRRGVLGEYRITTGGDVSEERFGGYVHGGERLRFVELRGPQGPAGR
jgi:ABC-type branched-subunit amino acid transport system substrate-binding protein